MKSGTSERRSHTRFGHSAGGLLLVAAALFGSVVGHDAVATTEEIEETSSVPDSFLVRVVELGKEDDKKVGIAGAFLWATCDVSYCSSGIERTIPLGQATSDANGEATFSLVALRSLPAIDLDGCCIEVSAHIAGRESYSCFLPIWEIEEAADAVAGWIKLLPGESILGRVVDSSGKPVCGASVNCEAWDSKLSSWSLLEDRYDFTDGSGYFVLEGGAEEPLRISVRFGSKGAASCVLQPGQDKAELRLEPSPNVIEGCVVTLAGFPIPGRIVCAWRELQTADAAGCNYLEAQADEIGHFSLHLPGDGEWKLSPNSIMTLDPESEDHVVSTGDRGVVLRDAGTFALLHTVDRDGRAVNNPSPEVRFHPGGGVDTALMLHSALDRFGESNAIHADRVADGLWLIELPGAGQYEFRAEAPIGDHVVLGKKSLTIGAGELRRIELVIHELEYAQPIEIDFRDVDGTPLLAWNAMLVDSSSGHACGEFSERGIPSMHCGPRSYSDPIFPVGHYRLQVVPPRETFHLPAQTELQLEASRPNRIQLRSAGLGGRILALCKDSPAGTHKSKELHLTLLPAESQAEARGTRRVRMLRLEPRNNGRYPAAMVLETGNWSWELRDEEEQVLERGLLEIRVELETTLEFNVCS